MEQRGRPGSHRLRDHSDQPELCPAVGGRDRRAIEQRVEQDGGARPAPSEAEPSSLGGPGQQEPAPTRLRDRAVVQYFRANPQVFVLLVICLVLGVGTFIAVIVALIASGSTTTTGEPSDVIFALRLLAG